MVLSGRSTVQRSAAAVCGSVPLYIRSHEGFCSTLTAWEVSFLSGLPLPDVILNPGQTMKGLLADKAMLFFS